MGQNDMCGQHRSDGYSLVCYLSPLQSPYPLWQMVVFKGKNRGKALIWKCTLGLCLGATVMLKQYRLMVSGESR